MEVGDTADLRAWILSFGAGAEVIEPTELRQALARELRAASARYSEGPKPRSKLARDPAKRARS